MMSHGRSSRRKGKLLLEWTSRSDDGIALHLEGVEREGDAASVIVGGATKGGMRSVESVLVEIQVTVAANARNMRREVGRTLASLCKYKTKSGQLAVIDVRGEVGACYTDTSVDKEQLTRLSSILVLRW